MVLIDQLTGPKYLTKWSTNQNKGSSAVSVHVPHDVKWLYVRLRNVIFNKAVSENKRKVLASYFAESSAKHVRLWPTFIYALFDLL